MSCSAAPVLRRGPQGALAVAALVGLLLVPAAPTAAAADLSAAQIVERNVAARGGASAWHNLQTLSMSGKMDAGSGDSYIRSQRIAQGGTGGNLRRQRQAAAEAASKSNTTQQVQLPFTLELKRPNLSRLELQFAGKTAVQVYDGSHGWKVRPFLNRNDVEPFTADEAKTEETKTDMDGLLIDSAAKGSRVELIGTEAVEGHNAYKLKVTTKSGDVRQVWVDSKSFLDVKVEGVPRRMDGKLHKVYVYQRDFRPAGGLVMPYLIETTVEGYPQTHKMTIETISVNKAIPESHFAKPSPAPTTPASAPKPVAPPSAPASTASPAKPAPPK